MAMALPTGVMAMFLPTMLQLIMHLHLSTMHLLLFTMSRAAIGKSSRPGYRVDSGTGLISIMTRAVMYGCWAIGRNDRVVRDTGRNSRFGLLNNKA